MSFLDKLRKKAEELELETRAKQVQEAATQAAKQAREKAGEFTAEHRDQIDGYVETASAKIDEKTDHRYSGQITKVKEQLEHGVDLVADGYGTPGGATGATGAEAAAGAASAPGDRGFPVDPDSPEPVTTEPVSASPLEPPAPVDRPTPVHSEGLDAGSADAGGSEAGGFDAAAADLPVPSEESLTDTALEDTVLGLDHPPVTPAHHDEPAPEDADPSTVRSPRPPHEAGS